LEKVFDRFYQAGVSDKSEQEGTGIGLALTKELVDLYRGKIHVKSELGKGSTFTVKLPVSKAQFKEDEIAIVPAETGSEPVEEYIHSNETEKIDDSEAPSGLQDKDLPVILIVEDNTDLRKYICQILVSEYQILEAENGREGLTIATEEIPDLVITDLMMPVMDGIELCNKIRNDQRTNHIPITMLTARADRDSKLEGLTTGADDYLIKPFDTEELRVRVKNLIKQRRMLREKFRKEFIATSQFSQEVAPYEDDFLTRVAKCINEHLGEADFGVQQLADHIGFSRSQLHRKIVALTGYVPNEFIRNIRLKQAARMFQQGYTNIAEVLYTVGFNTPSHFTQCFRELFGLNPSDFLKQKEN
jgi:DNA-binding response OmpR family regulator